jgi:hypothetical protein
MSKYIKVKENGQELFSLKDIPEFKITHKLDEIVAFNIFRGHGKITKNQAIRLAVHFYHRALKETFNDNDEAIHPVRAWIDEHSDVGDADQ